MSTDSSMTPIAKRLRDGESVESIVRAELKACMEAWARDGDEYCLLYGDGAVERFMDDRRNGRTIDQGMDHYRELRGMSPIRIAAEELAYLETMQHHFEAIAASYAVPREVIEAPPC
jgi:hypothetical protein